MAQNNSLFVWKTSNYGRGRSNLRTDMNQVTNLKSLGFTRGRIANSLGFKRGRIANLLGFTRGRKANLLGVFLRFFYAR